ncbi:MAG: MMPL family transporter [Desulfobacteraceae bacterium]|nr:MMPL family transporter [Desulfobacteraceae bacterium]
MSHIRHRIEKWFESFAGSVFKHRIKTIAIMGIIIGLMISRIPGIMIDTSTEGFFHEKDPELLAYNAFRDQFGRDEGILIALKPKAVFDLKFLELLKQIHDDVEATVPYIDDMTSLINARNTRGEGDRLIVEDLLENWPRDQEDLNALKRQAMSNPMYKNLLLSENGDYTTIVIRTQNHSSIGQKDDIMAGFDDDSNEASPDLGDSPTYLTDAENSEVVAAVKKIVTKYRSEDLGIEVAGSPVVTHFLKQSLMSDMRKFMVLALVGVAILLYLMFRRLSGVILPLLIVGLSLFSTIGIMSATGTAIKLPTQILPSFILAVGVGTSVHILAVFFQRLRQHNDKKEAIEYALGHSGLAVVMTNVTTAAGLMSFATADLAPVADLGIFAGIGVLLAFVYTIVLLPALIAILPFSTKKTEELSGNSKSMDRLLEAVSRFSTTHPRKILAVSAMVMVIAIVGMTNIRFSHHPLHWFPKDNEIRTATEAIDAALRGSITMEVVIDTGRENGLYDPDLLQRMDRAAAYLESFEYNDVFVGKVWSLNTIVKETNQALNEDRPEAYRIPDDRDLIAQELLLFENSGSDDLEDIVDTRFSKARFTMKLPFVDAINYRPLKALLNDYMAAQFGDVKYHITGMMSLLAKVINNSITSMAKSYTVALVVITILMVVLIGKVRIGLLSMIPNLMPILIIIGFIGFTPIPMDLFTMMVASIAIGLAVDDTIHFMHNFRRYYELSGDPQKAVFETLHTTGRAMLVTTVVLSLGFFIYGFATMQNIINFGRLTGITIILALLADYFVAPALMVLVNKPMKPVEITKG